MQRLRCISRVIHLLHYSAAQTQTRAETVNIRANISSPRERNFALIPIIHQGAPFPPLPSLPLPSSIPTIHVTAVWRRSYDVTI